MDIKEYSEYMQFYTEEVPELLLKYFHKNKWNSFLDLGCGDGSLLYALDKKGLLNGKLVQAIDLSESRINLIKNINKNFIGFVDDACNIKNIKDNSIDFLVSSQVIEHVGDDNKMVGEIRRILRDDGLVYLSTVFKKWYGWYFYRCEGRWVLDPTHLREYSKDNQLFNIFKKNGFEVIESKKKLVSRSLLDFVLRKLHAGRYVYSNPILRSLRKIRIPVLGYYEWEIMLKKRDPQTVCKIAVVSPTVFYYHVPLYRRMASSKKIDLNVFYCSNEAAVGSDVKKTYGVNGRFSDEDMLSGYSYKFLKNYSPCPSYLRWPFGLVNIGIWQEIKKGKYDAVVLQAWTDLTWYLAFLACLRFKIPVLFMTDANIASESFRPTWKKIVKKILFKFLFTRASGFLTAGIANEEYYKLYGVSEDRMVRFHFSWGYEDFFSKAQYIKLKKQSIRNLLGIEENEFVMVYIGRLSKEKNPEIILEAFNKLDFKNKKLFFVGDGQLRTRIEQALKTSDSKKVFVTGFQSRDKIGDFYAIADVLILASDAETWGIVVNEGMCFGLPIIASDQVGAIFDLVKDGYNGFIFPVGDAEKLSDCIKKIFRMTSGERLIFGERSKKMIKDWIDEIDPTHRIIALIKKCKNTENKHIL